MYAEKNSNGATIMNNANNNENKLTGYPSIDKPWLRYYSKEAMRRVEIRI